MDTILLKAEFVLLYFITATYVSLCVYIQLLSAQELNPCLVIVIIVITIVVVAVMIVIIITVFLTFHGK